MAKYINTNGETLETSGTRYTITSASGDIQRTADISNWCNDAEKWIDNDIKSGFYVGFKKAEEAK